MDMDFDDLIRILLLLGVVVWYAVSAIMRARNKESNVHNNPKNPTLIETVNKDFNNTNDSSLSEDSFDRQVRGFFPPTTQKEKPKVVVKAKPAIINQKKTKKHRIVQPKRPALRKPVLTNKSPLPILDYYQNPFVKGVIWSEVYGKPKALRDV
jgi:hypothetical protein